MRGGSTGHEGRLAAALQLATVPPSRVPRPRCRGKAQTRSSAIENPSPAYGMIGGMADVVYLHVGAPKTGTTYLQDRLLANRNSLTAHGVSYPVGPQHDMFPAALDLIELSWGEQRDQVRGEWAALVGRVRRAPGKALVSHEILAGATPAQVARAKRDLSGAELHVVYSARDLGRQIPAEWQDSIKHRQQRSFRRYLRQVQRAARHDPQLWFWRAQSLPDVLERWTAGHPPERVHLVTVPQPGAPRDELWRRYCAAFRIDPSWAPEDSDSTNASIGIEEIALLRALNKRLRKVGLDSTHYRRLVRQLIVHNTLARRPDMRRVTLPPKAYGWVGEIAEEWVTWVERAGIEVVGDLADLRPVPPAPGKWANPDKPRPRTITDAALDALVAVVLEAAQRPDHEQST